MTGLSGIFSIASQGLQADQIGLEVTANNIANANTPGYTRQVATFTEQAPFAGSSAIGGGVDVSQVSGVRDAVLDLQVNQETQAQNQLTTLQQQLQPLQSLFATSGGAGLDAAMDGFFNSLQQLSTNPSDGASRQGVLDAAQSMAQTFDNVATQFTQQQQAADQGVVQDVSQVNTLTSQIAALNAQIADSQNNTATTSSLSDQRNALMSTLSTLVGFTTTNAGNGEVTLSTVNGATLVAGADSSQLTTATNAQGFQDVLAGNEDLTVSLTGGAIGGLLQTRDQIIPANLSQLNTLASGIANAVNLQNQQGFTPSGAAGGNLFTVPASNPAAGLTLATADPNAIAASADGTAGDNGNVLAMAGLQQQTIAGGQTPDNAYAALVSGIGTTVAEINTRQQASSVVLTQLQNQQSAESGVSLDQEFVNLTRFQQAYQAAAHVVSVLNQLATTAIDLGLPNG